MTANTLSRLLAERHADAVFIPECKMGMAGSRILDGWALLPTWSPLTTIGYETKVSRSDWLQDQKFEEYRAVCHLFFVVAPKGIVEKGEIPAGVGLLEPVGTGTGTRLLMRVKAVRQEPDPVKLSRLMAYALMWKRVGHDPEAKKVRALQWQKWAADKELFRHIGASVNGRIWTVLREADEARRIAESRMRDLDAADALMREMGIKPGCWSVRREMERRLADDRASLESALASAHRALGAALERLASVEVSA